MPTLEWVGKEKVVNHHQEVPFRILDKKYAFCVVESMININRCFLQRFIAFGG